MEKIAVKDDPVWYAAVFSWAPGQSVSSTPKPLSDTLIQSWGSAIGQIQQISIECNRQSIRFDRPHWRDYLYADQLNEMGKSNPKLVDTVTETLDAVEKLEVSHSDFGIAHTDLHGSNLFVDTTGHLTCIDFDDCAYHYFLQDFTMPIYYALLFQEGESLKQEAERFFRNFLGGYGQHIQRKPNWFDQIPLFLRLRDLDLAIILRLWEEDPGSRWFKVNEIHLKEGHPMGNFPWSEWAEKEQSKNVKRLF